VTENKNEPNIVLFLSQQSRIIGNLAIVVKAFRLWDWRVVPLFAIAILPPFFLESGIGALLSSGICVSIAVMFMKSKIGLSESLDKLKVQVDGRLKLATNTPWAKLQDEDALLAVQGILPEAFQLSQVTNFCTGLDALRVRLKQNVCGV